MKERLVGLDEFVERSTIVVEINRPDVDLRTSFKIDVAAGIRDDPLVGVETIFGQQSSLGTAKDYFQ
jgi:hypothetical protein